MKPLALLLGLLLVAGCAVSPRAPTIAPQPRPSPGGAPVAPALSADTDAGTVWLDPAEPHTLWLSPGPPSSVDVRENRRKLFTFPGTIPLDATGEAQPVRVSKLAPAGHWVAVMLFLQLPGAVNGRGRLDAVNLQTGEHRVLTDAHFNGGQHFIWRAAPGRVYWEQQSLSPNGDPVVTASQMIDLATGTVSALPPGTASAAGE